MGDISERIRWHLGVPACRIQRGLRTHLKMLPLKEVWRMCFFLHCSSVEELERSLWASIKKD